MAIPEGITLGKATLRMLRKDADVYTGDRLHLGCNKDGTKFISRLYSVRNDGTAYSFASGSANRWAEETPGATKVKKAQHIPGDYWNLHISDFSVLRIANSWQDDQISYEDDYTAIQYSGCLMRFIAGEVNARRVYEWEENGVALPMPIEPKPGTVPNTYQTIAAVNAVASNGFGLFMEQGTGKTYPTIMAMAVAAMRAKQRGEFFRALVVCPLNVKFNWVREIEKFSPVELRAEMVGGSLADRIGTVTDLFVNAKNDPNCFGAVAIVSYKSASQLCQLFRMLGIDTLDVCVLDESHTIKNPAASISREMLASRDMFTKRIVLTGTPVGNSPLDLYTQLEFLYPGCSGFRDYGSFKRYYSSNVPQMASSIERLNAMLNMPLLKERIARNCFVITKAKALPFLPAKSFDTVDVKMTKTQRSMYNKLAAELALQIEKDLERAGRSDGGTRSVIINNALVKSLKLTQITSGFIKWDAVKCPISGDILEPPWIEELDENPKTDWLVNAIKELPSNEKVIVWACQTRAQHIIQRKLADAGIRSVVFNGDTPEDKRTEYVDAFNDQRLAEGRFYDGQEQSVKVFIGNQRAGGAGLNLLGYPPGRPELSNVNAAWVVYYVKNYSYIDWSQAMDRAHRVGTRVPIRVTSLLCASSIEHNIHKAIEAKRDGAFEMQDLRELLKDLARGSNDDE